MIRKTSLHTRANRHRALLSVAISLGYIMSKCSWHVAVAELELHCIGHTYVGCELVETCSLSSVTQ